MSMTIGIPQVLYLLLLLTGIAVYAAKHGQPRSPYSIWEALFGVAIVLPILYWGGFFS